jgi:hypothetical protein
MPRLALSAVRDPATSATDHCPASGRPDCTSSSCRWVRERPPRDFSTVTTFSDGDVRGTQTMTPQAAVTSSFLDKLQMTTPTSSQLPSPLTTGALVFDTLARTTLPSPQVSSPLSSFTTPRTEGLGQEDYYLRAITEHISSALASDLAVSAPEATQAPNLGTGTTTAPPAPPPPAPGPSSPTWSLLSEDDDAAAASGFSFRPSRIVSTSPPDPSSLPQPYTPFWCLLPKGEIDRGSRDRGS